MERGNWVLEIFRHLANTGTYLTVMETLYKGFLYYFAYGKYKVRILQHKLISLLYTLYSAFFNADIKRLAHVLTIFLQ